MRSLKPLPLDVADHAPIGLEHPVEVRARYIRQFAEPSRVKIPRAKISVDNIAEKTHPWHIEARIAGIQNRGRRRGVTLDQQLHCLDCARKVVLFHGRELVRQSNQVSRQ